MRNRLRRASIETGGSIERIPRENAFEQTAARLDLAL